MVLVADLAAESDDVSSSGDEGMVYRRGSVLFARVSADALEVRLPADIADAALRTPDTSAMPGRRRLVALQPVGRERHVVDRATAWFQMAWRHAGGELTRRTCRGRGVIAPDPAGTAGGDAPRRGDAPGLPGRCWSVSRRPRGRPRGPARWRQAMLPASAPSAGMSSARPNFFSSDSMGWKPTTPRGWSPGLKKAMVGMLMI